MIRKQQYWPKGANIAVAMAITGMSILFLYYAEPVLLPLVFSGVCALLLYPVCKFLELNGFPRVPAILLTMFAVLCVFTGLVVLLSSQIYRFVKDLPDIADKTDNMLNDLEWFMFKNFNIQITSKGGNLVQGSLSKFLDSGVFLLSGTISTFLSVFNVLGLLPIYLFLMLLYRTSFKRFFLHITSPEKHRIVIKVLYQVQKVVQNYIIGLLTVMTIVATLLTTSLIIIGVDYPVFFGCFAAMLMIIPYLGMFIGAVLPALYALLTKDNGWYAFAVMICFLSIQFIEGNYITPKVTGNRVNINPLAAIVALVVGGYIWGMGGLIIALPLVAILKVVVVNIPSLKHFGFLLGTEIYDGGFKFKSLFKKKPSKVISRP